MAASTLFLFPSIMKSITQQYYYNSNNKKSCQTLKDLFNVAKYDFSIKNYTESYRLFYELETRYKHRQTTCAWYQIQCLIQLGHTRHAIIKCHLMIQKEPSNAIWYLIASDIYVDQLDYTLAWEILNKAAGAAADGQDYTEILFKKRIAYEGLKKGIQRRDILDKLPYDIACAVFKCLDLASLVKCTRVNKKWRQFLLSSFYLWNGLEFINNHATAKMTTNLLSTYLARSVSLSKLVIRNQQITDGDAVLMLLLQHECNRLKTLVLTDIICTPTLFFNVLEYIGSTSSLTKLHWGGVSIRLNDLIDHLSRLCKNVKHLIVHDCFTSLNDIQLNSQHHRLEYFGESFPAAFMEILQKLPKLHHITTLELSGIHGLTASHLASVLFRCPNLKKLVLNRCLVNIIPVLNILLFCCPKLQYLEYERNRYCQQFDLFQLQQQQQSGNRRLYQQQQQQQLSPVVKSVKSIYRNSKKEYPWIELKIHLTNMLTDSILQNILHDRQHLQKLDLRGNTLISDNALISENQPPLTKLKFICLKECFGLTCKGIEQLISTNPLLEQVDLSCLTVINDAILYALSNCTKLQILNFSYCKLGSLSEEAVDYFIDKRRDTLKQVSLDYCTNFSMDLQLKIIKSVQRGIV